MPEEIPLCELDEYEEYDDYFEAISDIPLNAECIIVNIAVDEEDG